MLIRSYSFALCALLGIVAFAAPAAAEETQAPGGVKVLQTVVVFGARNRPSVAIEVTRAKPEIKLADLSDPKVEQIMRAAAKAPF
jgi:hypothetical protein